MKAYMWRQKPLRWVVQRWTLKFLPPFVGGEDFGNCFNQRIAPINQETVVRIFSQYEGFHCVFAFLLSRIFRSKWPCLGGSTRLLEDGVLGVLVPFAGAGAES